MLSNTAKPCYMIALKALLKYYSSEEHQETGVCSPYFIHSKANKQENLPKVVTTQCYRQDQEQNVSDTLHFSD